MHEKNASHPPAVAGVQYALGAYGSWGLLPVYWKQLTRVPVFEILAHRVVWSVVFTALLLTASRGWRNVRGAFFPSQPRDAPRNVASYRNELVSFHLGRDP
ncbi:MAG TPA: hypothetical protein VKM54_19605 [Myxococcota bacterium]|nr:hypothetical protein [Myxococcota bacterium]